MIKHHMAKPVTDGVFVTDETARIHRLAEQSRKSHCKQNHGNAIGAV